MATRKSTRASKAKTSTKSAATKIAARRSPARSAARRMVERRQPETLRLRSVAPSFTVDDLARSLKFYTDALGFIVKERWTDNGKLLGVMLQAGVCELGLSQDDWAKGRDRKKGVGMRVWCETNQDIDALARRIKAAGGRLSEEPRDQWGSRRLSVVDLDGFQLTIHRKL